MKCSHGLFLIFCLVSFEIQGYAFLGKKIEAEGKNEFDEKADAKQEDAHSNILTANACVLSCVGFDGVQDKLYLLLGNGGYGSAMITYDLDKAGMTIPESKESTKQGHNQLGVSVDNVHNKVYVLTEGKINVFTKNDAGKLSGIGYVISVGKKGALALNSESKKLYVCHDGASTPTLQVYDLDESGVPVREAKSFRSYQAGADSIVLIFDACRKKLYLGNNTDSPNLYVYHIDASGEPHGEPLAFGAGSKINSMSIDSVRRKLYIASSDIYIYDLDEKGQPSGTPYSLGFKDAKALILDAARNCLYFASKGLLQELRLDENGNPKGKPLPYDKLNVSALLINSNKNKLHVFHNNGRNMFAYDIAEAPLKLLQINSGQDTINDRKITLNLQAPNPHWICVSGDLESIGAPVSKLDEWVSVDGNAWSNDGGKTRAKMLSVPAVLKPGSGKKQIKVLYRGSSSTDYDGLMEGESVTVELKAQ